MRVLLAAAVLLMGISVSGLAQQSGTFKVKRSAPAKEKEKKSAPIAVGKTAGPGTASASNSKDLQAVERETAKTPASSRTTGKKTGPALKPVKDKPNPPINFGGNGGAKGPGTVTQGSNPYKGRVKQKHSHQ
jgi:hypothetical protein